MLTERQEDMIFCESTLNRNKKGSELNAEQGSSTPMPRLFMATSGLELGRKPNFIAQLQMVEMARYSRIIIFSGLDVRGRVLASVRGSGALKPMQPGVPASDQVVVGVEIYSVSCRLPMLESQLSN